MRQSEKEEEIKETTADEARGTKSMIDSTLRSATHRNPEHHRPSV